MTTYIPIVLLTMFGTKLEKAMCNRLRQHLHANNILVPEQFGFRKGLSTNNAVCKLKDIVFKSCHQRRHAGEVLCESVKACDYKLQNLTR
jgi:hypothetical protein